MTDPLSSMVLAPELWTPNSYTPGQIEVDPKNPLSSKLWTAWTMDSLQQFDKVGSKRGEYQVKTGAATVVCSGRQRGVDFTGSGGDNGQLIDLEKIGTVSEGTILLDLVSEAASATRLAFVHSDFAANHRLYFGVDAGTNTIYARLGSSASVIRGSLVQDERAVIVLTWKGGSAQVYKNGIKQDGDYSYSGTPGSTSQYTSIGSSWNGTTFANSFDGPIYTCLAYKGWKNATEVALLSEDPMRVFRSKNRAWIPPVAVGGVTIPVFMNHYRNQGIA